MTKRRKTKKKKTNKKEILKEDLFDIPSPSYELRGMILAALVVILGASLLSFQDGDSSSNWLGLLGYTAAWGSLWVFGLGSYLLLPFLTWIAVRWVGAKETPRLVRKSVLFLCALLSFNLLVTLIAENYPSFTEDLIGRYTYSEYVLDETSIVGQRIRHYLGGVPAYVAYKDLAVYNLKTLLNDSGIIVLFGLMFIVSSQQLTKLPVLPLLQRIRDRFSKDEDFTEEPEPGKLWRFVKLRGMWPQRKEDEEGEQLLAIRPDTELEERPSLSRKAKKKEKPIQAPEPVIDEPKKPRPAPRKTVVTAQAGCIDDYQLPPLKLLTNPKKVDQTSLKKDLRRLAEVLEETLLSFGIEAKVGQINCGPTVTSFEVHPSIGVKVQKIRSLEHDLALNLEAKSIRIIAPIPGKAAVGIEVPNPQPQEVSFKEIVNAYQSDKKPLHCPVLLGKTVTGEFVMADLTKMPHCVIAGATGSGKSVCINSIVMSILMNARPDEVRLLMIDPKKVELTPYTRLPHMLAPVITEAGGACSALNWLVKEMEKRYELLKTVGARNIVGFNSRKRDPDLEAAFDVEIPDKLPYIIGIIDELADLMMVAQNDIETPIARIAQMARAVGIHLILATQRPSREVITGLIKANFPTRIAFKVSSRINSQIILDETGAESLLGNGDMLFLPPGTASLTRAQGCFVRDEDINAVIDFVCKQAPVNYLIDSFDQMALDEDMAIEEAAASAPKDTLFDQALETVLEAGSASTSFLQRKLKIGYSRAASLMDELEEKGVVGPAEGSKPRRVLHLGESPVPSGEEEDIDGEA